MLAPDGKMRLTDAADTETMLRLIQPILSPNAEPFKLWLARVGGTIAGNARREIEKKPAKTQLQIKTRGNLDYHNNTTIFRKLILY